MASIDIFVVWPYVSGAGGVRLLFEVLVICARIVLELVMVAMVLWRVAASMVDSTRLFRKPNVLMTCIRLV